MADDDAVACEESVACEEPAIHLDSRQTRRLLLAGTAALPAPFPSTGTISIECGTVQLHSDGPCLKRTFVVIQHRPRHDHATIQLVRLEDAAAVFIPGDWKKPADQPCSFRCRRRRASDLERGEWFLASDITVEEIKKRIGKDVSRRNSGVKGIVFVPEHLPVYTITDSARLAGAVERYAVAHVRGCCPCICRGCCCGCDDC